MLWQKLEWFEPMWVARGRVDNMLKDIKDSSGKRAFELFDYHTSQIYNLSFMATCVAQFMPQCQALKEFHPLIREAFLAFYGGYRASSIAALIPLMEGALNRMVPKVHGQRLSIVDTVEKAISSAIAKAANLYFDRAWAPVDITPLNIYLHLMSEFRYLRLSVDGYGALFSKVPSNIRAEHGSIAISSRTAYRPLGSSLLILGV